MKRTKDGRYNVLVSVRKQTPHQVKINGRMRPVHMKLEMWCELTALEAARMLDKEQHQAARSGRKMILR